MRFIGALAHRPALAQAILETRGIQFMDMSEKEPRSLSPAGSEHALIDCDRAHTGLLGEETDFFGVPRISRAWVLEHPRDRVALCTPCQAQSRLEGAIPIAHARLVFY